MESRAGEDSPRGEADAAGAEGSGPVDGATSAGAGVGASAGQAQAGRGRPLGASQIEDLIATVRRLEAFAADEAKRVSGKLVPQIESRAKENIWVSLLLALGLGLILGIWLTGGRRRD